MKNTQVQRLKRCWETLQCVRKTPRLISTHSNSVLGNAAMCRKETPKFGATNITGRRPSVLLKTPRLVKRHLGLVPQMPLEDTDVL